ncbi:MAG: DMT family transporter [Candidatus Aminicenantes bacterium]|jgi:drug/metabolite transporter (DMT)-like permease
MEEYKKLGATDFFMLLVVLFWAINFTVVKIALRQFSPLGFNGLRLLFSALVLIFLLVISREGLSLRRADFWAALGLGIIGHTGYQLLFIHGLNWTKASNTSIIMGMTPVFIALLSTFLKHEKIQWAAWLGILISFAGFYLVITQQGEGFQLTWENMRGDVMIFTGNILWATYTVFSRPFLDRVSPLKWATLTLTFGTVFYIPLAAPAIFRIPWKEISFQGWMSLLYSGLFAIVVCYILWYTSVKRIGNSKTAIYGNLNVVFSVSIAYIFLAERITPLQVCGAVIILAGVSLTRFGYRFFKKK